MNNVDKTYKRPKDFPEGPSYPDLEDWVRDPRHHDGIGLVSWIVIALAAVLVAAVFIGNPLSCRKAHAEEVDLAKIERIESNGNPNAYNKKSGARGLYQITAVCLRDFNLHHVNKWTAHDLYRPTVNKRIARWYIRERLPQLLKARGHAVTVENLLVAYNAGIKRVGRELPKETKMYLAKYRGK
jgi:hypothetical protein